MREEEGNHLKKLGGHGAPYLQKVYKHVASEISGVSKNMKLTGYMRTALMLPI